MSDEAYVLDLGAWRSRAKSQGKRLLHYVLPNGKPACLLLTNRNGEPLVSFKGAFDGERWHPPRDGERKCGFCLRARTRST